MTSLYEMEQAAREAKETIRAADNTVGEMLPLVVGRLRKAAGWNTTGCLRAMKAELKDFDSRTGRWK